MDRLQIGGAIFLHARFTEPWTFSSFPAKDLGKLLAPDVPRVIPFHVVITGRCWVGIDDIRHWAEAGDIIVLPYGDMHRMGGTEEAVVVKAGSLVPPPPWAAMPSIEYGGGGAPTEILCGYMHCDDPLFDPALKALAPEIVVKPTGAAATFLKASIEYALSRTAMINGTSLGAPPNVAQMLLIEVLKLHLASVPAATQGFIAALRDPIVAPALAQIHEAPGTKWTVADLARLSHVSESALDERFRTVLGIPPIRYLTAWRMHLAQDLLATTDVAVAAIAHQVGYESEEAFSRAFKRKFDVAPSVWRVR